MNSKTTVSTPDDNNSNRGEMRNRNRRVGGDDRINFSEFYEMLLKQKGIDVV